MNKHVNNTIVSYLVIGSIVDVSEGGVDLR